MTLLHSRTVGRHSVACHRDGVAGYGWPVKDDFVTLRPFWNLVTVSACALGGCAGAVPGAATAQSPNPDPYSPNVAPPAASQSASPDPRLPVRATPAPVPKLTTAQEVEPDASQATATSAFGPPPIAGRPITQPYAAAGLPRAPGDEFAPSQIVGQVGDQIILYGDVAFMVNQVLEPHLERARTSIDREQIESQRDVVAEQMVKQIVETKLLYQEFLRRIPRENRADAHKKIDAQINEKFELGLKQARKEVAAAKPDELDKVLRKDPVLMRLALMMHERQLETPQELDAVLRAGGSSLDKQRAFFGEYHLGQQVVFSNINLKPEVTHQEMLNYYRDHADQYAVKAKVRFEILSVYYEGRSKEEADQKIRAMGNAVYFGTPFKAVAQRDSQDPNAAQGGYYDWTNQGSLASRVIDEAIFSIDIGKLSQVLYDDRGCHIVRVLERTEATQIPFTEAQLKIKEAIQVEKRNAEARKYLEELRKLTPVWTIYEERRQAQGVEGESAPR